MDAYLTIAGSEFIVGYIYRITSPGAPQTWEYPAEPMEYEVSFVDLRKDDGDGKETSVDCPDWLKAEIETWLYEEPTGKIYEAIEENAADSYGDELDAERGA